MPKSAKDATQYLLEIATFDDALKAIKETNPWKHAYAQQSKTSDATALARFLWRHVIEVRHPVIVAVWVSSLY